MSQIFQSVTAPDGEKCSICHKVIQGCKIEYSCNYKTVTLCLECNKHLDELRSKLDEANKVVSMCETEYSKELCRVFEYAEE